MQLVKPHKRFALFLLSLLWFDLLLAAESKLDAIHDEIVSSYEQVDHIKADDLLTMNRDDLVIFDVREQKEFSVSHIDGAIQLDPAISADEFAAKYADSLNGKTAVFYCSVGRRSSKLAARVDQVVEAHGASASYNLIGGVFRWRNEDRPLMSLSDTATNKVHPYNWYWSRLIEDKKAIQYSP